MSDTETAATVSTEASPGPVQPTPPAVTSLTEWRRKAQTRYRVTLPMSKNTVEIRKPDWGKLLADKVLDPVQFFALDADLQAKATRQELYERGMQMARAAAPYIFVNPPVAAEATDGALGVTELDALDLGAVFTWARGIPSVLEPVEVTD